MAPVIIVSEKIDTLQFREILTWERFQLFCTDLLYKRVNSVDSREYLKKGNTQHGIDIYIVKKGEKKISVAQCKLQEYLGPKQISGLIDQFLIGDLVSETSEFILCTNADLKTKKDEEAIAKARKKLSEHEIDLIIWDESGISRELRTNVSGDLIEIVYHYFDELICRHFYGDRWEPHIQKLKPVEKHIYQSSPDYIERNVISYEDRLNNPTKNTFHYWNLENPKNTLIKLFQTNDTSNSLKVVLLSTAGFGKSEELQNLAAHFSEKDKPFYPVKFSLGNYEGEPIQNILINWNQNWKNISQGNILLVFDGLDEMEKPYFQSFLKKMNTFIELYPQINAVISSRFNFYEISHQPLNDFKIYLLDPLTRIDIEQYLNKQLTANKDEFIHQLEQKKFDEYITNPYYLTRLVRFFKDKTGAFPNNKTELFDRILFEQLNKDQGTYNIPELKKRLYPIAGRIAFCMTLAGKSSLTDDELNTIIPDADTRRDLNHFCILNRNASKLGVWTFEHKNLQEYLCAAAFKSRSFADLHKIISFDLDGHKLLPRFLNTISFLFELLDKNSTLFIELFDWINKNEPELLVRFEKEQLSKNTRNEIFFRVFDSYKEKKLSLRTSPNFSIHELARFVEVDETIIDFLIGQIKPSLPLSLLYDSLNIVALCQRSYILKEKLVSLLFDILENPAYPVELLANCIRTFYYLQFTDKLLFDKILSTGIDVKQLEIRKACLTCLLNVEYSESYSTFILDSIEILEKDHNYSRDIVKNLILKFRSPEKIKQVLQYCITDNNAISAHHRYREFQFSHEEVKSLLDQAIVIYATDKSILRIVYRLYCNLKYISSDKQWNDLFINFFDKSCGKEIIFHKFHKSGKRVYEMLAFADEKTCDFLLLEYNKGKLTVEEMQIIRNIFSHINPSLFKYIYSELLTLPDADQFVIEDINTNYEQIRIYQVTKNQQMLLDKSLFFEEAETILSIIAKDEITSQDLWFPDNVKLRPYRDSLVLEKIRDLCRHDEDKKISKPEFYEAFQADQDWNGFVIDSIKELLEKNKDRSSVKPELIELISNWCLERVDKIYFLHETITDNADGTYMYYPHTEFVKRLILLLDIRFSENQLLKLLFADYSSFYKTDEKEKSIMSIVLDQTENKALLRETVLCNLKNDNLSFRIHATHFKICQLLGYRECLPLLYKMITENRFVEGYDRIKLTEIYLDLGGQLTDFSKFLAVPSNSTDEKSYVDWHWYLIENLLHKEQDKISGILLKIISEDSIIGNKVNAAESLIKLSRIEGLEFWLMTIKDKIKSSFEDKWESLYEYIRLMPFDRTIEILFEALKCYYQDNFHSSRFGPRSIGEAVFNTLTSLAIQNHKDYSIIKQELDKLIDELTGNEHLDSLKYFSERLTHRYFESISQEIDIQKANLLYEEHFLNN